MYRAYCIHTYSKERANTIIEERTPMKGIHQSMEIYFDAVHEKGDGKHQYILKLFLSILQGDKQSIISVDYVSLLFIHV